MIPQGGKNEVKNTSGKKSFCHILMTHHLQQWKDEYVEKKKGKF